MFSWEDRAPELSGGELEPVLEQFEIQDAATWIAYPDWHHLPARVRFLTGFLVERLRASDRLRKGQAVEGS